MSTNSPIMNQQFAESSLPVMLSTQWTSVYDKELQEMLGLYSLCSFIFYKTDHRRSVYLGVCPVLFAQYLKCRCAADQLLLDKLMKYLLEHTKHLQECKYDPRVNNGRLAMNMAIHMFYH